MKNKISLLMFSLFLMFLFGSFEQASACSCVANVSTCQRYGYTDTIFVGKVINIKRDEDSKNNYSSKESTTFEVEEIVSGTKSKQIVVQNRVGTSCDISFEEGEKYLIFANGNAKEGFSTGYCSGNMPLANAEKTLLELRNLPKAGAGGKIYGNVHESFKKRQQRSAPVAGIDLKIQEIGGRNKIYKISTDSEGNYELIVPQGKYKVSLTVPPYADPSLFFDDPFFVKDRGCVEKSFGLYSKSQITGKVIDAEGTPVENIQIELLSTDDEPSDLNLLDGNYTDEKGKFLIENVPAGRYTLSVNFTSSPDKEHPFPPTYYPNASRRENAMILEIGLGQSIDNLVFRLPPRILIQKIYGTIILPDGRPAAGMTVNLGSEDGEWWYDRAKTDENGNFVLNGFIGEKYCLSIDYYGDSDEMRNYTVKKNAFTLEKDTPPFRLILEKKLENKED